MADVSRFPHLAPPFAIVGAAAGWLSAGLVANPLVRAAEGGTQEAAALCAMIFGGWTGLLLTHWCVRRRYRYELDDTEIGEHVTTDTWWRHVPVVLAAGASTGAVVAAVCGVYHGPMFGALGGFLCSLAFVPVCVAVILAARRARRARLGSIVAGSDRRAVWGILATALSIATLEAAPDWPAARTGTVLAPWGAIGILAAAAAVIGYVLAADRRALRQAGAAIGPGLAPRDPSETHADDTSVPKLDLGLGDDIAARVARSAAAYRGRDRTLALVQGSPEQAITALRRAVRRGKIGVAVAASMLGLHLAGTSEIAGRMYDEERCHAYDFGACARVAHTVRGPNPRQAALLYERACHGGDAESCARVAAMYEGGQGIAADPWLAAAFHEHACAGGVAGSCRLWRSQLDF